MGLETFESQQPTESNMPQGYMSLRNGAEQGKYTFVRTAMELAPFLGEMGIDVRAIQSLAYLAGFKVVRIDSENTTRSQVKYGTKGIYNSDNTLSDTLVTAVSKVDEGASELSPDTFVGKDYIPRGKVWSDLTITVRTAEIEERLKRDEVPLNDRDAWAHHINTVILAEIVDKGVYNLLASGDWRNQRDALGIVGLSQGFHFLSNAVTGIDFTVFNLHNPVVDFLAYATVFLMGFSYMWPEPLRKGNGPTRFSLFGVQGPALDRAARLVASASEKLINPIVNAF